MFKVVKKCNYVTQKFCQYCSFSNNRIFVLNQFSDLVTKLFTYFVWPIYLCHGIVTTVTVKTKKVFEEYKFSISYLCLSSSNWIVELFKMRKKFGGKLGSWRWSMRVLYIVLLWWDLLKIFTKFNCIINFY